jgi:DNA-binding GntR family transcriptional regulator
MSPPVRTVYSVQSNEPSPLSRQPLGRQIADQLRRDILFGVIGPDDHLTQEAICLRFGTSRIPVRDAIQQLVLEGILRSTRSRIEVVQLTERDLEDIFRIEGVLHALATRLATERATDEQLASLAAINSSISEAQHNGRIADVAALNEQFHRAINLHANSSRIVAALRATSAKITGEWLHYFPDYGPSTIAEHEQIVAAMQRRDAAGAEALMLEHAAVSIPSLHERLESLRAASRSGSAAPSDDDLKEAAR